MNGLGSIPWPIKTARVLEGGASQVTHMTYNAKVQVEQVRSGGTDIIQQYANYNAQHLPGTITDAAGHDTDISYNSGGQLGLIRLCGARHSRIKRRGSDAPGAKGALRLVLGGLP